MKQEEKQLLLQDLCARLPYGVKIQGVNPDGEVIVEELSTIGINGDGIFDCNMIELSNIKPYLFPMNDMTEKQLDMLEDWDMTEPLLRLRGEGQILFVSVNPRITDWLNAHHFDHRGLIEKSLAIDATGLNIYKEEEKQ